MSTFKTVCFSFDEPTRRHLKHLAIDHADGNVSRYLRQIIKSNWDSRQKKEDRFFEKLLMGFPSSLHFGFDFRAALADGTITEFVPGPDCDKYFLRARLSKLRIVTVANGRKWTIDDGSR
jgi:hypothetical protein